MEDKTCSKLVFNSCKSVYATYLELVENYVIVLNKASCKPLLCLLIAMKRSKPNQKRNSLKHAGRRNAKTDRSARLNPQNLNIIVAAALFALNPSSAPVPPQDQGTAEVLRACGESGQLRFPIRPHHLLHSHVKSRCFCCHVFVFFVITPHQEIVEGHH